MQSSFWRGKKVLITGHTGFKGGWLSLWLQSLGAKVTGVSLDPPTEPSLYKQAKVAKGMVSIREDIRNENEIRDIFQKYQPEIVFHLAAQPLVRYSYRKPVETYETNVMGTLHILEAIRNIDTVEAAVVITTDKCYENKEWVWGYRENDQIGGYDPYSSSKGAAELLIASYRNSYLPNIASVRAGNVIGGGDWAKDRIIPDAIRAFQNRELLKVRNPYAIRPWQHVLEPLAGYIELAEQMTTSDMNKYAQAWNFGPNEEDARSVEWIVQEISKQWDDDVKWDIDTKDHPHEANYLKLDCSKARTLLNWSPKWNLKEAINKIVEWHKVEQRGVGCRNISIKQVNEYMESNKK